MKRYHLQYQRPGDKPRIKRGEGGPRRFTRAEARHFLFRNRVHYPHPKLLPIKKKSSKPEPRRADRWIVR